MRITWISEWKRARHTINYDLIRSSREEILEIARNYLDPLECRAAWLSLAKIAGLRWPSVIALRAADFGWFRDLPAHRTPHSRQM
jgi:hypothetical protein